MLYRIGADIVVLIHFGWIVFILAVFFVTAWAFVAVNLLKKNGGWEYRFLDRWVLRSVHLAGIIYASTLSVVGRYCPMTILENFFRRRHDLNSAYPGGFIIHYIERIVYPDVSIEVILIPTAVVAILTVLMFAVRPPLKVSCWFKQILLR